MLFLIKKITIINRLFELKRYLWKEKRRIAYGVVFLIIAHAVGLYLPMLNHQIFDKILPSKNIHGLLFIGGIVFILGCVEFACGSVKSLFFKSAAEKATANIRSAIFSKLSRVSYRHYSEFVKGDLHDIIMNDTKNLSLFYFDRMVELGCTVVVAGVTLALMFRLSVNLTLVCLILTGITSVCALVMNKKIHDTSVTYTTSRSKLHSGMFDMLTFMPLIKICCAEKVESERFKGLTTQLADSTIQVQQTVVLASGLVSTVQNLIPLVIFIVGVFLMIRGQLLLGKLLAFSMYFSRFRGFVSAFYGLARNWQRCKPSLDRILGILHTPDEDAEGKPKLSSITRNIEASGITLTLKGVKILKGVSLIIPRGKIVAIVGPNGSGKSSLLKVLSGLLTPDDGCVLVDGKCLTEFNQRSYRHLCGFVFQNTLSLNRTIRETVCYRSLHPWDDKYIYAVLEKVGLRQFVQKLPETLDTELGEMSANVSGGELQRLSIARELANQPKVLFLDEATASIDAVGESEILGCLKSVCTSLETSVVFVTHYLSTLRFASLVYVMKEGMIHESGTPEELAENGRFFQQLFYEGEDERHTMMGV